VSACDTTPGDLTNDAADSGIKAEDAVRVALERFELADDPETRGELAVAALEQLERQLELVRADRLSLDRVEVVMWAARSRLERFLIETRGKAWWRARPKI
jgi:hypothetical protein